MEAKPKGTNRSGFDYNAYAPQNGHCSSNCGCGSDNGLPQGGFFFHKRFPAWKRQNCGMLFTTKKRVRSISAENFRSQKKLYNTTILLLINLIR